MNRSFKFGKSTEILYNILSFQRSPFIKTGLGYEEKQNTPEGDANTKVTKPPKRKMKKSLKVMLIFSKAPSTMKEIARKEMMTNRNPILLTRTIRMSSK